MSYFSNKDLFDVFLTLNYRIEVSAFRKTENETNIFSISDEQRAERECAKGILVRNIS
jgi:hypothetical protein